MKPLRLLFVIVSTFVLLVSNQSWAQLKVESISAYNGLANPQIYAVSKDPQGFMWFGSADGVKRYDGYEFISFNHNPDDPNSLSANSVGALLFDKQGQLWAGTWGGGLNLFVREKQHFIHFKHDPNDPLSLGANKVQSLFESRDGTLWVGTNGGGLNRLREDGQSFERFVHIDNDPNSLGNNRIWSISEDLNGGIWVGTSNGLYRLDRNTGKFQGFGVAPNSLDHAEVRQVSVDEVGQIWVATRTSFGLFNPKINEYTTYNLPSGSLPSVTRLMHFNGDMLLATFAGIYRFAPKLAQFVPVIPNGKLTLLQNRDVRQVLIDDSGLLWAATRYSGVQKVFPNPAAFISWQDYLQDELLSGLFNQVLTAEKASQGGVWLGTGRGLVHFDGQNQFTPFADAETLQGNYRLRVHSMARDEQGQLYAGTSFGLYKVDELNKQLTLVPLTWLQDSRRSVEHVSFDSEGYMWLVLSGRDGMIRWQVGDEDKRSYIAQQDLEFVFHDSEGQVWAGTDGEGVFRVNPVTGQFEQYTAYGDKVGPNGNYVTHAMQQGGYVWLATNRGVTRFELATKEFKQYVNTASQVNFAVKSIVADAEGFLWFASASGVFKFDPTYGIFHQFTTNDGLINHHFLARSFVKFEERILFGSIDGITGFNPKSVQVNTSAPPVAFTQAFIDGNPIDIQSGQVELNYNDKNLSIHFAALDYQATGDNRYRTWLVGYHDGWSATTPAHTVNYRELPPGEYQLKVQGSNNHGVWNQTGIELSIISVPAWYQTLWFRISLPVCAVVLLLLLFWWRVRQLRENSLELERKIARRTRDIVVLGEVGKEVAATYDMHVISETIYNHLSTILHCEFFAVGVFYEDKQYIDYIYAMQQGELYEALESHTKVVSSADVYCVAHGEEFYAATDESWQQMNLKACNNLYGEQTKSVFCAPLIVEGKILGVFTVQSNKPRAYKEVHLNVLRTVANHVAVALANSLSYSELKEAEQRLELAMQGANAGTWEWDCQSDKLVTNAIWSTMLGYQEGELEQQYGETISRWRSLLHPDDLARVESALQRHLSKQSETYRCEFRMRTSDDSWKWILSMGRSVNVNQDSRRKEMFGIHMDISDAKELETALKQAKERAESATQAKSDFLSNMSHEIRTPMNAIIGMSYLALETELDHKQRNYVDKIHRSAESLLGIINDILDFSKIEAGKLDIEHVEFCLEETLSSCLDVISVKAKEKGLELCAHIDADIPTYLIGDPLRISQVLLNLGSNAVKFTEQGGEVLLDVRLESQFDGDITLKFAVIDSGIGMTTEQQAKLFSSFSQADTSTTRKYGGTGLGLAISKKLVELMQGDIDCQSAPGVGSTFSFTLVVNDALKVPEAFPELGIKHALIIDDNSSSCRNLQSCLGRLNIDSECVGSSQVESLTKHIVEQDVVFIDARIENELGLLKQLRAGGDDTACIVMPLYETQSVESYLQVFNRATYLQKPFLPSAVDESLQRALGLQQDPEHDANKPGATNTSLAGAHLLLVEDNDLNQELAIALLSRHGISVDVAEHGAQALEKLSAGNFDGVLMDCQMPVMDGYTATRKIREQAQYASLPIIAMTASVMMDNQEAALACGMNDIIGKPLNVEKMFATLQKWIVVSNAEQVANASAQTANEGEDYPKIAGIDVAVAKSISQGDVALFTRLLRRFADKHQHFNEHFEQAMLEVDGDPDAPMRCAHTLKGTAGNIGATEVHTVAGELESACAEGQPVEAIIVKVQNQLMPLIADINRALSDLASSEATSSKSAHAELSELEISEKLAQLTTLLTDYDTDAIDLVGELLPVYEGTVFYDAFNKLNHLIDDYDFDAANELLAELKPQLLIQEQA
ncbi:response regulator [Pseudoalteromonas luteoviolacea]|uniref:two-component regulator propeller domain-containing protein n=1 Tax=Pseudoalteromonas luteoviolacea TaxID=43657 RepID=UPI001B373FB2|nr:two-component regulator propeller domain-containing protein [Pseudoalteromonas luteoviolacea]MBQ4811858.1 response regulator [Pseudoalteromonas luteoviolacea]